MAAIPISQFEHRVARWATEVSRTREPLEISQRGVTRLVVLDLATFEQWKADRARLEALEIKLLVDAGEAAFRGGKFRSHEQVGRTVLARGRAKRRAK